MDCCSHQIGIVAPSCPACCHSGRVISTRTVENLLIPAAKRHLDSDGAFYFCAFKACPIVYFSPRAAQAFTQDAIKVQVWQKAGKADDVLVCYCFGHTSGEIRADLEVSGETKVLGDISRKMKEGLCACETNNPQGSCCLGNINTVIQRLTKTSGKL